MFAHHLAGPQGGLLFAGKHSLVQRLRPGAVQITLPMDVLSEQVDAPPLVLAQGLAPTFACLLGARALLGLGIAPTLPAVMAIIAGSFSGEKRGRAMGLWALVNGAAHASGPPLSGFLTQHVGWRAPFVIVLPLCLLNLWLVWRLVPPDGTRHRRDLDLAGAATLTGSALGLMLALTQSARWGWFSAQALGTWGLALAILVLFIFVERRAESPFVELSLIRNRGYAAATGVIAAQYFCLFGLLLALPVFLIQAQGWSDQVAGLLVLPLPLTMAVAAPLAGRLADALGSRRVCAWGMGLVALAGLGFLALHPGTGQPLPWAGIVGCLLLMGLGMGLTQSPVTAAVTCVVDQEQMGVATGIFHMGRFVSGSLGSTVFGLILQMGIAGMAAGFRTDLVALVIVAALAVLVAQGLPGRRG